MKTKQQVFNMVVEHLAAQKKPSKRPLDRCLYKAPGGMECAIGCLIPDELGKRFDRRSDSTIANDRVWMETRQFLALSNLTEEEQKKFYSKLQEAHDDSDSKKSLKGRLTRIAKKFGLNPAKVGLITEWKLA